MNSTFATSLTVSALLSCFAAACGGGGGAAPKTAAEPPPSDLPASTKAETKAESAFAACHNTYKPSHGEDVASDVAAMAKGCADITKMNKLGDTHAGELNDKAPVKLPLAVLAGKCYRVYGMSQSTMQDFDIALVDSAGALVSEDTTDDVSPVIAEDGKVCFKTADTVTLKASAGAGGGKFAFEVWSD